MITGEYRTREVIKPDAKPVDNVTKFAWDDDDYITITEWHDFDAQELKEEAWREIGELTERLNEGSDAFIQLLESMTLVTNPLNFISTFIDRAKELRNLVAERNEIRAQIEELKEYVRERTNS